VEAKHLALPDPITEKIVTENKDCANLFTKTFKEKVNRLVEQVGVKDAMVNEINKKFPHNPDYRSPQFETTDIINVIPQMKNSSKSGHDGISMLRTPQY